jgi:hypothetical protein
METSELKFSIGVVATVIVIIIFFAFISNKIQLEHNQRIFSECVKHASVAECYLLIK